MVSSFDGDENGFKQDREKAQTLLREAVESYTQIGMPYHVEMAQSLLD
jgi:hypothetical protein